MSHLEDRVDQLEQEVFINNLSDRINQLEKKVKELEKEMHDCRFYQGDHETKPERETPPFDTWSDEKKVDFFDVLNTGQRRYEGGK